MVHGGEDCNGLVLIVDGLECLYLFAGEVFPLGCVWRTWYDEGKLGGKRWVLSSELVELAQRFLEAGVVSHDGEMGE